jgi:hypothetical protein
MTGRRPYWSESEPMMGEQMNCIPAHRATKTPLMTPGARVRADEILDQARQHRDDDPHGHDVEHRRHEDEGERGAVGTEAGQGGHGRRLSGFGRLVIPDTGRQRDPGRGQCCA